MFDRTIHLSTTLISNLVNQKVAPGQLTLTGLQLWVDAVKLALAAEASAASAAGAAAAGDDDEDIAAVADSEGDSEMGASSQPQRKGGRVRVKSARAMGSV